MSRQNRSITSTSCNCSCCQIITRPVLCIKHGVEESEKGESGKGGREDGEAGKEGSLGVWGMDGYGYGYGEKGVQKRSCFAETLQTRG